MDIGKVIEGVVPGTNGGKDGADHEMDRAPPVEDGAPRVEDGAVHGLVHLEPGLLELPADGKMKMHAVTVQRSLTPVEMYEKSPFIAQAKGGWTYRDGRILVVMNMPVPDEITTVRVKINPYDIPEYRQKLHEQKKQREQAEMHKMVHGVKPVDAEAVKRVLAAHSRGAAAFKKNYTAASAAAAEPPGEGGGKVSIDNLMN